MELCEPLIFRYFRRYTYFRFSPVYSGADSEYGTLRKYIQPGKNFVMSLNSELFAAEIKAALKLKLELR